MKFTQFIKKNIVVLMLVSIPVLSQAQPGNPGGSPGGVGQDPDPNAPQGTGVPLDLGLSAMIAVGVGYAAKRKHNMRLKENNPNTDKLSKS